MVTFISQLYVKFVNPNWSNYKANDHHKHQGCSFPVHFTTSLAAQQAKFASALNTLPDAQL